MLSEVGHNPSTLVSLSLSILPLTVNQLISLPYLPLTISCSLSLNSMGKISSLLSYILNNCPAVGERARDRQGGTVKEEKGENERKETGNNMFLTFMLMHIVCINMRLDSAYTLAV